MQATNYRADLPQPIPQRLRSLPIERGMPAPWFTAVVDGHHDFRVTDAHKLPIAVKKKLCWICGQKLGSYLAFPIGAMCAINRTISEPPSHRECAEWSIKACPFLAQRQYDRRESNLPEGVEEAAGIGLKRQPGAICLWITRRYTPFRAGKGVLFELGDPTEVLWFCKGREATYEEVMESIDSGLPSLMEMAKIDGPDAVRLLNQYIERLKPYLPVAKQIVKR